MSSALVTVDSPAIAGDEPMLADARLADALRQVALSLAEAVPPRQLVTLGDEALLDAAAAVEHLGRYVDALRVEAAAEIAERSTNAVNRAEGLAAKKGCRNAVELIERITRASGRTAHGRLKLGKETKAGGPEHSSRARFPLVADALESGLLGTDAASAILAGLRPALRNASMTDLQAAEDELVAAAIGTSQLVPTACTADELRQQAMIWQAYLDPEGMEPIEARAWKKRGFEAGVLSDGLVRGRYALLPEVAARLTRLFDAYLSPRVSGESSTTEFRSAEEQAQADAAADPRSRDQQRHDILAAMIDHYARSDEPPRIGGAAPTVLVTVRAEDLEARRGRGHIDGAKAPIAFTTVRHLACNGGYQFLSIDANGAIHGLGSPQRCFTPTQRRAIIARDGGCIIPGCTIPASWCEIHHVDPAENGGSTHTDNGVLLCWAHHRTIDTSGWQIRMIDGAPYVKPPPWIDPAAPWRPATKSPTMSLDAVEMQTRRR